MEMELLCFILLFTYIDASLIDALWKSDQFSGVYSVEQSGLSFEIISSNTGVQSCVMCAMHCINEGCLSFSYTAGNKTCVTYSRLVVEENQAETSNSTLYFSRTLVTVSEMPNAIPFSGLASGVHDFTTTDGKNIEVFYDMDTKDGPWIVIQRRTSDDVVFHRNWTDYKNGFGDLLGNFWIGNDNLHLLTPTSMILRVELEAWDGTKGYAQYSEFQVANEAQNYRLSVQGFSGNVSYDALSFHDGYDFTSFDRDNDIHEGGNCAQGYHGSWWFSDCFTCNLNGLYVTDNGEVNTTAIIWRNFPDQMSLATPLKKSKMMIR